MMVEAPSAPAIDYPYEDGRRFPAFVSRVTISNPDSLSRNETGSCQNAICDLYFTKK
jgi:hypothetical protein